MPKTTVLSLWLVMLLAGCQTALAATDAPVTPLPTAIPMPTATTELTATSLPPTGTPIPAAAPVVRQTTFDVPETGSRFANLTVDALTARHYGGSGIVLGETIRIDPRGYTQYAMSFESDGLRVTGLINIPAGDGPFPVAICNHGYRHPSEYEPGFDSWRMADWLAERNYIAIMPDFRNYGDSDTGPNPFRIGYAVDLMNLVAQLDSLPTAAPEQVGIMGHSMGGEVAMWPMVISEEVDAIVLYASMSGDVARNWHHRWYYWAVQRDAMEAVARVYGHPDDHPEAYTLISPITYLDRVRMPVHIHHGRMDPLVPFWWAEELHDLLVAEGKDVRLFDYGGEAHGFTEPGFQHMMGETLILFDEHVRGNTTTP
ncbi:MAG: alpha/beta fold hydrolase [Chloroflexi bacterium]|nr:alpha/beta fold hydrolase [Chloroflexota bacterium]